MYFGYFRVISADCMASSEIVHRREKELAREFSICANKGVLARENFPPLSSAQKQEKSRRRRIFRAIYGERYKLSIAHVISIDLRAIKTPFGSERGEFPF